MWGIPRVRRRLEVRRFRRQLTHVDFVALAWRESLRNGSTADDMPMPAPEGRRGRRGRRGEPEPGGELV